LNKKLEEEKIWWHGKFGADQTAAAVTGNSKERILSTESFVKGIKIQASGGSTALKTALKFRFPLPGKRTVQRRTQHIRFQPSVLHIKF